MARVKKQPLQCEPWTFRGEPFTQEDVNDMKPYGFVYLITNRMSGRMYVGRKYFTAKKGKVRIPSNWEVYFGSSDELLADIEKYGHENFERIILSLHKTRGLTNYGEVSEQMKRDVLTTKAEDGSRLYYNGNILSRWFVSTGGWHHTDEWKRNHSEKVTGKVRTPEMRAKYSETHKGIPKSAKHKEKLAAANRGKKQSKETISKRSSAMQTLRWWNDGTKNCRSIECPEGWLPGRIKGWKWQASQTPT